MGFIKRVITVAATAAIALAGGLAAPVSASAASSYVIGVDNAAPAGNNWSYVDFFPNQGTKLHSGAVVDFKWNPGALDGFHTATLLPQDTSVAPPAYDLVIPDFDDPPLAPGLPQLMFNPTAFDPTDRTCGTAANPCTFSGLSILNSGAKPNLPGTDFWVQVNADPGTYSFVCLVHPGMKGTFAVVGASTPASTPEQVDQAALLQYRSETSAASREVARIVDSFEADNGDGTRTVTLTAGAAVPGVEILEMLPARVDVNAGDTVRWVTRTLIDIHTVTFPRGAGSDSVDPFQPVVEFGEGFEFHVNPLPQGATVISTPSTVGSSGILANRPGQPNNYAFSFPNPGTFNYQCRIHDHMLGSIVAQLPDEGN